MVNLKINHKFLGGNNPRTEIEEIEGRIGDTYKIRNRSNSAYKIDVEDLELLTGTFNENKNIDIHYRADVKPTSVELVPDTIRLEVGETAQLGYKLIPEGDYNATVNYKLIQNDNVAIINGSTIRGREIGFGLLQVTAVGEGFNLTNEGSVMVSGAEEGE